MSFPLKLSTLKPSTAPHLAVIGNAAQTMHPVAGQGFNVGMRDAWTLADLILNTPQEKWGNEAMLTQYTKARQRDTRGGILFTDLLVNVFGNEIIGLQAALVLPRWPGCRPMSARLAGKGPLCLKQTRIFNGKR